MLEVDPHLGLINPVPVSQRMLELLLDPTGLVTGLESGKKRV